MGHVSESKDDGNFTVPPSRAGFIYRNCWSRGYDLLSANVESVHIAPNRSKKIDMTRFILDLSQADVSLPRLKPIQGNVETIPKFWGPGDGACEVEVLYCSSIKGC
jgi:hypothetical protein